MSKRFNLPRQRPRPSVPLHQRAQHPLRLRQFRDLLHIHAPGQQRRVYERAGLHGTFGMVERADERGEYAGEDFVFAGEGGVFGLRRDRGGLELGMWRMSHAAAHQRSSAHRNREKEKGTYIRLPLHNMLHPHSPPNLRPHLLPTHPIQHHPHRPETQIRVLDMHPLPREEIQRFLAQELKPLVVRGLAMGVGLVREGGEEEVRGEGEAGARGERGDRGWERGGGGVGEGGVRVRDFGGGGGGGGMAGGG